MKPTKLEHYRSLLETRADTLRKNVMRELRARPDDAEGQRDVGDAGDESIRLSESAMRSHINAADAQRLQEIDEALDRLGNGTYGLCQVCEEPIDPERLELIPEARRCAFHQERFEEQQAEKHPTL